MEIRLENIQKKFSSVVAVHDMNIRIKDGSLTGLLGPSGCGKSTTLFMIAGLYAPTAGNIFFGDEAVTLLPPEKRGIGLVFQNYALYPHMTVLKNILFPLENMKIPKKEALKMAEEMADIVQIRDLLDRKPSQLSGGQQQRVAIARALVKKARVLLLDEPLSNLDARLRLETREEIRRIQKETGITTIYVTHDQEEAMSITDDIVLMDKGWIQQQDSPQQMYLNPGNQFTAEFLGNPPVNIIDGKITDSVLVVCGEKLCGFDGVEDQPVVVGIRPEAVLIGNGDIKASVRLIEIVGKDKIISLDLKGCLIRAIVSLDYDCNVEELLSFSVKHSGVFLFDKTTGARIKGFAS
ncbi:MAG: ABC transporter ATP-binding protein [Spirochaetales bacterium]|nr:ABC transporter ATP-binding protein [Spirochaetales bacterium]